MNFQDNIIRDYLKNVIFISGLACGGKSTMAKRLADEYNLLYINETENYARYSHIANKKNQPFLSYQRKDWNLFFNREKEEYDNWLYGAMEETAQMLLFDLVVASQERVVITDAYFPIEWLKRITDYHNVLIMVATTDVVINEYFKRQDKLPMLKVISSLDNSDDTLRHFEEILAYSNTKRLTEQINSGYKYLIRNKNSDFSERYIIAKKHLESILNQ